MSHDAKQHMIQYRVRQSEESISEARNLLENNFYRGAINRAYYAMFYGVQALMLEKGLKTAKHSGAISMFDLEFVKSGVIRREYSKWLHDAFELRLEVDYGDLAQPDQLQAKETMDHAVEFVSHIKQYLTAKETE